MLSIYSMLKYLLQQGKEEGTGLQAYKGSERVQNCLMMA
jgi:hypothetical protein